MNPHRCWNICDEPEWYSRCPGVEPLPYDSVVFTSWVRRIVEAIREEDPEHPVMLGFGHIASADYGMNIRDMAELLDCMGVTAYPLWADSELLHNFRNGYFVSWSGRFNDCAGKGYFCCEAPGFSSINASEESIGKYFRVVLYSDPRVEVGVWQHPDGRRLILAVNHAPASVTAQLMSIKKWGSVSPHIGEAALQRVGKNKLELSFEPCEMVGLICCDS